MLNSADTQVLPNFPSSNYRNNAKNMLFLNDGKPVVSPYMGGYDGDIILKTVFQPDNDKRKFIEDYLGRPPSPISGLRNDVSASAQPPGLSAVRQPSSGRTIPQGGVPGKNHIPGMAGAAALIPHEGEPAQRAEGKTKAPAAWNEFRRGLGVGTRNIITGLGRGATLGMGDPGAAASDWMGLPEAKSSLEKNIAALSTGALKALPMALGGAGAARMAASPVVRGVGASLASSPAADMTLGGLLNLFLGGD